jgi:ribosome-associated heat shock protein Hsp15
VEAQRLDKWLWCARLAKTRTLAAALVAAGKIRVNGQRADKPSRLIRAADVVTGTRSGRLFVVRVVQPALRRGSAAVAATLYEDLTHPMPEEEEGKAPARGPRPTKRNRRRIDALLRAGDA